MTRHVKALIRRGLVAAFVIGGGILQFLYRSASHPSALLEVWAWIYSVLGILAIAGLVIYSARYAWRRHVNRLVGRTK